MCGFLWCQGETKRGKAKVYRDDVCLPTNEGGLGVRKLDTINIALMTSHIWKLITHKESMWVRWIHAYKLKKRSFWEVPLVSNVIWGWRKLLQIRNTVRPYFWYKIGNGEKASVWYDTWDELCPLMNHVSYRGISNAGFDCQETLANVVSNGSWTWPHTSYSSFPILNQVSVPTLHYNHIDTLQWKLHDGTLSSFSVRNAWHTVLVRGNEVDWFKLVWSTYSIPRHAIHLWLVKRKRLLTQDRMREWDVGSNIDLNLLRCPLCKTHHDSHDHLFFECAYSSQVWAQVLSTTDVRFSSSRWSDIMNWLIPIASKNNVDSIVGRLIVAASSYFIWQERNNIIHGKGDRRLEQVTQIVVDIMRLKLASIRFKKKARVDRMHSTWKISNILSDSG
ncbi:putative reverse transcriptase zinc-binding domain-containing protein [Tanacetum coccineum]